ncbi:DUF2442 domain-containing protein [Paraburkholderia sp. BCC1885]|uniref:DUF2442 domain-containing protein n=1 Tax=Paraburkholderia sp. BCC1885 TaxID=2562669 RepID=UPI001642525D|nr:DUF2442 domain-containing protein [Paraburkholderia sp. BCC1885]
MAVTTESIAAARKAGKALGPRIVSARYRRAGGKLEVEYENGVMLAVPVALIQEFALLETTPSTTDLSRISIWGGGYDLHFSRLDMFVHGTALLKGILGTKAWMREHARSLGTTKSPAKAAAARENGKKGGRPRKQPVATTSAKQRNVTARAHASPLR